MEKVEGEIKQVFIIARNTKAMKNKKERRVFGRVSNKAEGNNDNKHLKLKNVWEKLN